MYNVERVRGEISVTCVLFLPRDATQSAVMPQFVVCLSVRL